MNESRLLAVPVALLLVLCFSAAAAMGSAAAPEHVATEVTIAYDEGNDVDTLTGVVNADNDLPACVRRDIEVYRKKSGPDQLFARTESLRTQYGYGIWGVDRDRLPHGKYYAVARKKRAQGSNGAVLCEADRTEQITAP